jgi:hypothetical protein
MDKKIQSIIDSYNKTFGQNIAEADIFIFETQVYLSTAKVADLLRICNHQFSIVYAHDVRKRVHMIHQGRNKWYDIKKITQIMKTSIKTGDSFLEICKNRRIKLK